MGLLYRKHLSKDAFVRVTLSYGKRTAEYIEQTAMRSRLLKGQAISRVLEDLINDPKLQEQFKQYAENFKKIDDDQLEYEYIEKDGQKKIPKIHHTNFEIPAQIIDRVNKMMFDFRFVDRNKLIRTIIHFFNDQNQNEQLLKKAEELKSKISELGFKIVSSGVIDGEIFVRVDASTGSG